MQEILDGINWAVFAPLIVIQFILWIVAIIDLSKAPQTNGPKLLWFLIILCISMIGPVLYFIFGRRQ